VSPTVTGATITPPTSYPVLYDLKPAA